MSRISLTFLVNGYKVEHTIVTKFVYPSRLRFCDRPYLLWASHQVGAQEESEFVAGVLVGNQTAVSKLQLKLPTG
jgi:hypothetical protein